MPIYTVELDGQTYDIEGDRPPTEADARAAIGGQPKATRTGKAPGVLAEGKPDAMSDEAWAAMPAGEKMRNVLQWAGKAVSGATGMGDAGRDAVDNPKTFFATSFGPGLAGKAMKAVGKGAYKGGVALLPRTIKQEFPDLAEAGMREGVVLSRRGSEKAGRLLSASAGQADDVLRQAPGVVSFEDATAGVPALKSRMAQEATGANNPDLSAVDDLVEQMRTGREWPIGNLDANEMKRAEQGIASKIYRAMDRGQIALPPARAELAQNVAQSTRQALERNAPAVGPINARTQSLIGLERAAGNAGETGHILSRLGGIGAGAMAGSAGGLAPAIAAALAGATLTTPAGLSRAGIGLAQGGDVLLIPAIRAALMALMSGRGGER
jgi:hypothetical protein